MRYISTQNILRNRQLRHFAAKTAAEEALKDAAFRCARHGSYPRWRSNSDGGSGSSFAAAGSATSLCPSGQGTIDRIDRSALDDFGADTWQSAQGEVPMDCRRGGFQAHGGVRNCDATVLLHHQRANVIEMVDGSQPNEKIMYLKTALPPKTWPRRGRKRRRKRHEPPTGQLCRRAPGAAAQTAGRVPVHDTGPPPRPATAPGGCRRRSGPGSGRRWTTPRQGRSRFRGRFPVSLVQAAGPAGATAAVAEGRLATRSDPCGGGLGAALVVRPRTLVFAVFGHRVFLWLRPEGVAAVERASPTHLWSLIDGRAEVPKQ